MFKQMIGKVLGLFIFIFFGLMVKDACAFEPITMATALAALTAVAGTAAVAGGTASAFGAFDGGNQGKVSRSDIIGAMQLRITQAESQRQASLAAGRTAIGEAYSEGLREIQGQIPELLGKRNLVGVGPNVISATTPGQQVYSRGVQSLTAQKMAALANLEGRGAQSAFASLDPQLQALGLYGEEEGGGMMDFLSSIAGIGGTFYGMQQQGEQNKWLRDLLKGDDDTIDTTADVSNVGTLSNPRGESVVRL